tara:strand:+ start:1574 stop:2359 length:786 start_codon:yes stop_codon:yes gene_type:complete
MNKVSFFEKFNLTSRLIELVILFIAVTLGFIGDNYREDLSEKNNAKKLLSSMEIDLKEDLVRFETFIQVRKKLIKDVYNFIDDADKRGLLKHDVEQHTLFAIAIFNWNYFKPNTANIDQVISSGALRYLGNDTLINQIGVLESKNISLIDRQEREQEFFLNYLQPLMHKYYNFKWANDSYVRKWEAFSKDFWVTYDKRVDEINPSNRDMMFWNNSNDLKIKIINLFENYVFILRSSHFTNYDDYLDQIKKTIQLINSTLEQ